jgi:hypothetical protein
VQLQQQEAPRRIDPNIRLQLIADTYYRNSFCTTIRSYTFLSHSICIYCYTRLDRDFARAHLLTVVHYICIYDTPPLKRCEICNITLTKYRRVNRCRRCVYHYRKFVNCLNYEELTEFYLSPRPFIIEFKKINYEVPHLHEQLNSE